MNKERLTAKRELIANERKTIKTLQNLIFDIVDELGLDEEKMTKRIQAALGSEYGRVNGLVNLLAAVCNWPADQGDGASVMANRKQIEDKFPQLDMLLLADIRNYRGFHTFHNDELEIISGQEPNYEDYEDFVAILLEDQGLTPQRVSIDADQWTRMELRAKETTTKSITMMREAVEAHKALLEGMGS